MTIFNAMIRDDNAHHDSILANGYTGCDVLVMSQCEIREYKPGEDEVCISIGSQTWGVDAPRLSKKFKQVLALEFDDTAVGDAGNPGAKTISDEDALKAVKFFQNHLNESKKIVIHCYAGMSRSRSMAGTLCLCFQSPFEYTILNDSVKFQILKAYKQMRKEELECLSR